MLACDLYSLPHSAVDIERLGDSLNIETMFIRACKACGSAHFHLVQTEKTQAYRLICVDCLADIGRAGEILTSTEF